jgi:hypothetical protein
MDIAALEPDAEAARILSRILAEFAPDDPEQPWTGGEIRVAVPMGEFQVPELVRAALLWAGFVDQRWDDKTAWRLGGRFRDQNISFSSTKFGLRIMVETHDRDITHALADVSHVKEMDGLEVEAADPVLEHEADEVAYNEVGGDPASTPDEGPQSEQGPRFDDLDALIKAAAGRGVKVPKYFSSTRHDLSDDPELEVLINDFIACLRKAARVFDKHVFARLVKDQVTAGNVTLLNQSGRLRGAYTFFRWQAQSFIDGHGDEELRQEMAGMGVLAAGGTPGETFFTELLVRSEVGYCLTAMASAYFSWLEHVLVLALPFTDWDPAQRNVTEVIGDSWADKWRYVVPNGDAAATAFDRLKVAAEEFRNLDSHGGFGKKERSLLIHTPLGAMPARLMEGADAIRATIIPEAPAGFPQACAVFDATDEFLRTGPLAAAMAWIEGGLQVPFHSEHRQTLKEAMAEADEAFEEVVNRFSELEDRINNFEMY